MSMYPVGVLHPHRVNAAGVRLVAGLPRQGRAERLHHAVYNFALKSMSFAFKMVSFSLKMMAFAFIMMNFGRTMANNYSHPVRKFMMKTSLNCFQ